jgi:SulP family sulfate permease
MQGEPLWLMLGLVALTMAIIQYLPMLTTAIPSSLAAIITVTLIVIGLNFESRTVGDMASIAGGLPEFHLPMVPFSLETLWIILPYSIIFAAIGLIESLLTLTLIDEITETRGRGNKECVGQGAANVVTGLFGGMGGCAMIGQSMINVNSGGRGRLSGISAALFLLIFILFASGLIEMIPLAALTGVMFMVVIGTFEWSSFRIMGKIPKADAFIIILVSGVTVATDLAIAVVVGVIVSALVFAWEHAKYINVTISDGKMGSKIYELNGPLFFASVQNFQELFDVKNDPDDVVVEFQNSRVMDHSAIEAIDTLAERYLNAGKRLHLRHLTQECQELLEKAGDLVEVNVIEDPKYHVADDRLA